MIPTNAVTGRSADPPPSGSPLAAALAGRLKRDPDGLVCAVVQQFDTGDVLMVGWMDDEALHRTLTSGRVTFWSRSRQEYWRKGDTSGHVQWVRSVALDCDGDAVLVAVDQVGAACHTGRRTCFDADRLDAVVGDPTSEKAGTSEPAVGSRPAGTSEPAGTREPAGAGGTAGARGQA